MDKKEKRRQELRSFWMERNHIESTETDYLKKMYEVWVENNEKKEENDDTK